MLKSKPDYAWWCPVCEDIRRSETCPNCPDVLLLKLVKRHGEKYWRKLS